MCNRVVTDHTTHQPAQTIMSSSAASPSAVAPMRKPFQFVWKAPTETCWRGVYRWEDEKHEGWKEALQAFPYKVWRRW